MTKIFCDHCGAEMNKKIADITIDWDDGKYRLVVCENFRKELEIFFNRSTAKRRPDPKKSGWPKPLTPPTHIGNTKY